MNNPEGHPQLPPDVNPTKSAGSFILGKTIIGPEVTEIPGIDGLNHWRLLQEHNELVEASGIDKMTGLKNREAFDLSLNEAIEEQEKLTDSAPGLGVMFVDLDNFKLVNDTIGHEAGDKALIDIANFIRARLDLREEDLKGASGRRGGDEFVVMLKTSVDDNERRNVEQDTTKEELLQLAKERTRQQTEELLRQYVEDFRAELSEDAGVMASEMKLEDFGVSIGFAMYKPGDTVASLLKRADNDMYREKFEKKQRQSE